MWNLENWYRGTYLQNRNREADVGKRLVGATRGGKGGRH